MTIRQAAGFDPMHATLCLHGGHRVGNQKTGLDPESPEARQPVVVIEPLRVCIFTEAEVKAIEAFSEALRTAFFFDKT